MLLPISIHALREEGDVFGLSGIRLTYDFYPRPPRGGRHGVTVCNSAVMEFLSTPSARRATYATHGGLVTATGFLSTPSARRATVILNKRAKTNLISIHALREEGDDCGNALSGLFRISIHALREEGDRCCCGSWLP